MNLYRPRPRYIEALTRPLSDDFVRILTGVRRSGKSTLLELYREELTKQGVRTDDILSINFEDFAADYLRDPVTFHEYVVERNPKYLHVDEVQEMGEWARVINSLRSRGTMQICVTGSNASLFAGQTLTYLAGRYVEFEVFPLSLAEFRDFRLGEVGSLGSAEALEASYSNMLRVGTFPAVAIADHTLSVDDINRALFDSIFTRDIVLAGGVRDPEVFLRVARFVYDNAGSPLSSPKIARTLSSAGFKVSHPTVEKYLQLLESAHLIYQCRPYDIRGKQWLRTSPKYYWIDPGIRNSLLGVQSGNLGHDLENLVFLELRRRGYDVSTGMNARQEVDFRATKAAEQVYVQVAFSTADPATLERELRAFEGLPPGSDCVLISADRLAPSTGSVRHIDAFEFLAGTDLQP